MDDHIQDAIRRLVDEEHALRAAPAPPDELEQHAERLQHLEEQLDQCWDLLRQRRALRSIGVDPANAAVRPPRRVDGYLQ